VYAVRFDNPRPGKHGWLPAVRGGGRKGVRHENRDYLPLTANLLADRRGWPFFDLDEEIERHFGLSIERLQARFLTGYDYRKDCGVVLERIATANPDCVIALPPSGLRDAFLRVVRRVPGVTVAVRDAPENILERITFYDIDSRRIEKHLTGEERILYLKEIKADISYFKRSY
jgi:shikimate kinase